MSGVMTLKKLDKMIASGVGAGRFDGYQSWIRIRRKLSSPVSNLHSMAVPLHARALQLLSGLEQSAANVALWLGVSEIREQHPAWPEEHPHPASGVNDEFDAKLGLVPGLLTHANAAGIDHGVYPGTRLPFVATVDFTLGVGPWHDHRLVHWSCKPRELLDSAPNKIRMHERIEMERLYSRAVGSKHVIIDGTAFKGSLIENLDWMRPLRSELKSFSTSNLLEDFSGWFMQVASETTITGAKYFAAEKTRLETKKKDACFRAGAWLGLINIDMERPVVMGRPMNYDSENKKQSLKKVLLGLP